MADQQYIAATGVIVPDTGAINDGVVTEWRSRFGEDLRVSADTPQGVLITAETLARRAVAEDNAALANQINPDLAGGQFLDALCALLGLERIPASRTQVNGVILSGRPNTFIPQGVRARSTTGDLFATAGAYMLDSLGSASVTMLAVETGPVASTAGTITAIVDPVLGWEGVTNPTDGIPGVTIQSDASLRDLRRRTLALQGISTPEAVISEVSAVPNVRSLQFRENITDAPATIDGIPMVAHSVWICVDGGTDTDVALALLTNKTAGAAWNGATAVSVVEPSSGQTYVVLFDRPDEIEILVRVTIRPSNAIVDPQTAIPAAIVAYANGLQDGERGFVVGGPVSPFELAAAVNRASPLIHVVRVEVAPVSTGVYQSLELPVGLQEVARVVASSVTVVTA